MLLFIEIGPALILCSDFKRAKDSANFFPETDIKTLDFIGELGANESIRDFEERLDNFNKYMNSVEAKKLCIVGHSLFFIHFITKFVFQFKLGKDSEPPYLPLRIMNYCHYSVLRRSGELYRLDRYNCKPCR